MTLSTRNRTRRGAAAVEMVVSLFVILPLAFYMVFLQDLILYKLNQQEGVLSAAWDFQVASYQETESHEKMKKVVQRVSQNHRRTFFDHTSAYNSYNSNWDAKNTGTPGDDGARGHHVAQGAHECWVSGGAQLPTCYLDRTFGRNGLGSLGSSFYDAHNRGGAVMCDGQLGVFNKFLPQKLFQQFTNADLMKKTKFADSSNQIEVEHDKDIDTEDYRGAEPGAKEAKIASDEQFMFPFETHSIMVDTWALNYDSASSAKAYLPDRGPNDNAPPLADKTIADAPGFSHLPVSLPNPMSGGAPLPGGALHPFLDRVTTFYKHDDVKSNLDDAKNWHDDQDIVKFLSFTSTTDGHGDLLSSPPLHFKEKETERRGSPTGYSSGWADEKQHYQRQSGYMGESDN
jgi:predicted lactoylglutathione lyase